MAWTIDYTATAEKQLRKLDKPTARRIVDYMDERIGPLDNVRAYGKALAGVLGGYWRYRIGDHRVIFEIHDNILFVVAVRIGHRKKVYR